MGAEKVLSLIMKKLKDYRTNRKEATPEDKAKHENLMKLLRVYSTLRKNEIAKMKPSKRDKGKDDGQSVEEMGRQNFSTEFVVVKCEEEVETLLDDASTSTNNLYVCQESILVTEPVQLDVNASNVFVKKEVETSNNSQYSDSADINNMIMIKEEYDRTDDIESDVMTETIEETHHNNKRQTRRGVKRPADEQFSTVDGFLVRLGEGLKRLPYKQRAKLEIEYLGRLYEIQDKLGIFDK